MWRCIGRAVRRGALIALVAVCAPAAFAEDDEPEDEEPTLSATRLAEEFSDPLTTLPQLFLQDVYTPKNYGIDESTNRVVARIIVPRVPRYSFFPFVQLIRPSFSLLTLPEPGGGTRTDFGDMQLLDLAVIPPSRDTGSTAVGPSSSSRPPPTASPARVPGRSARPSARSTRVCPDGCSAA